MGLGKFILGGALQGVGGGMQRKVEDDVLARREARLQALRQQERMQDRQWQKEDQQRQVEVQADRDNRLFEQGVKRDKIKLENEIELAGVGEEAAIAAERRREESTKRLESFRSRLLMERDEQSKRVAADIAAGKVFDVSTDDDGRVYAIYGDGRAERLEGVKGKSARSSSSDGGILGKLGETAPNADSKPQQTVTMADVEYTAKQENMTVDQVLRLLEIRGTKVID